MAGASQPSNGGGKRRLMVIINPSSGQGTPDLRLLNRLAHSAGWEWEVQVTNNFGDDTRFAQSAVERGLNMVAAYGGDGTVMDAAAGLLGSDIPLAIIPGGTGNAFAKELLIPTDFAEACNIMMSDQSRVRTVDIGAAGDRLFLLRMGVGLEADITHQADRSAKDRLGILAYLTASVKAWNKAKISRYTLEMDGKTAKMNGLACTVANAATLGMPGVSISQKIKIDDGLLDVFILRRADMKELASLAASVAGRSELMLFVDKLPHWQCREVSITSEPVQSVEADGEEWDETPVHVRVLPGALKVITPARK